MFQHAQALAISCAAVAHRGCQRFDCLDVVRVDVQAAKGEEGGVFQGALEVACEAFD